MSLILDALNRAEHDRKNKNAVPDINTVHTLPAAPIKPESPKKSGSTLVTIILLLVVVLTGGWLARSWFASSEQQVPATELSSTQTAETPTSVESVPVASAPVVTVPVMSAQEQSTAIPVVPSDARFTSNSNTNTISTSLDTTAPAVENLYAQQTSSAAAATADVEQLYAPEEATVSESVVNPFAVEREETSVADPGMPLSESIPAEPIIPQQVKPLRHFEDITEIDFNELPWNQRQQIPTISYSRHNYLQNSVSTVMINGEIVGEGNSLSGGQLIVVEIFVDGVVLNFRGNKFKLRALNGWVNM